MTVAESSTPILTPGERLRRLRQARDLQQSELAELVEISQAAISGIERDQWIPRRGLRRRIASALDVTAPEIWTEADLAGRARVQ